MLFFKLLAALPIAVVAAPTGSVDTKAVARSEAGLVLRDTTFVKTERQLVPGVSGTLTFVDTLLAFELTPGPPQRPDRQDRGSRD